MIKIQPLPSESSLSGWELALFLHCSRAQNSGLGLQMEYLAGSYCAWITRQYPLGVWVFRNSYGTMTVFSLMFLTSLLR